MTRRIVATDQEKMMRLFRKTTRFLQTALISLIVLSNTSCHLLPEGPKPEPGVIVIRNRSGADLALVSLSESRQTAKQPIRFGSISPVPDKGDQSIERQAAPPRLPREVAVEWEDAAGRIHRREVSIADVLRLASGGRREAIVFEIRPGETVFVYLEAMSW